jgi:VanZ family protein
MAQFSPRGGKGLSVSELDSSTRNLARDVAWYGLPPLVWMGFIFFLSAQAHLPGPSQSWLFELLSNVGHFTLYGLLAFWWHRALGPIFGVSGDRRGSQVVFFLAFLIAVLYGLSDEFHQSLVPGRDPSLVDWGVDALGAVAALGVIAWRKRPA